MAHKLVKYRLNENGTIPDFVLHGDHTNGLVSFLYVRDDLVPAPQNGVMLCITVDNPTGMFEEIETYEALLEYISEVGSGWKIKVYDEKNPTYVEQDYDPVANAQWVWNRIQAINA